MLESPGTPPYTPAAAEPLTPGLPYHSQVDTPPVQPAPPVFDPNLRFERPVDVYAAPAARDTVPGPAPRDAAPGPAPRDRTHSIVCRLQAAAADVRHARTVLLRVAAAQAGEASEPEPDYAGMLLPPISVVIGGHMI